MKKKNDQEKVGKKLIPLFIALILGAGIALFASWLMRPKMAFVRTSHVFAEFSLSKELHKKLEASERSRSFVLDSLSARVEVMGKQWESLRNTGKDIKPLTDRLRALSEVYEAKKMRFEEEGAYQAKEYDKQIWAQLNPYVQEYVKEKNISYLFGADGTGALMGADKSEDHTEDLIAFVNKRYQGLR